MTMLRVWRAAVAVLPSRAGAGEDIPPGLGREHGRLADTVPKGRRDRTA
ncbi:hypothetical protein [Streptomyces sp. NPDC059092]